MADSYYKEGSTVRLAADVTNDAGGNLVTPKVIVTSGSGGGGGSDGGLSVGGYVARVNATFTRPGDINAYVAGDLVANNVAAGSVAPMVFALARTGTTGKGGMIRRARLRKTAPNITNASFRLHLYSASPVASNGDNGAWLTDQAATYVGSIDISCDKAFSDGAAGNGVPGVGAEIIFTADTYYGLLEARAGYAPGNAESFSLLLEVMQN